ncbi:uncharacterized protein si:ch211-130h14.4 isoform X2 [Chiloscyllium plagiosum]|uniref:uncharacterized protein si:ch211-130h14.4 isoform X2 n=1 Tax=Chiloscyllium plagiosum TaxID=36176 RepID=UPI001CB806CD|nr:uncharacterized protein si:ch211-130h14.4 isoform X2 [Chiloscyllium plagiosum]
MRILCLIYRQQRLGTEVLGTHLLPAAELLIPFALKPKVELVTAFCGRRVGSSQHSVSSHPEQQHSQKLTVPIFFGLSDMATVDTTPELSWFLPTYKCLLIKKAPFLLSWMHTFHLNTRNSMAEVKRADFKRLASQVSLGKRDSLNEDEEDLKIKAMKKALQEQRHLEVYKNVYKLCNVMRLQYMDLLNKKVQQQRHVIKQRDLLFQRNTDEQEKRQNTSRQIFGQQSECAQLYHEIKYLKSIPKSHFYMIVELQDQLAKNGILKNQGDYEEFWRLLKQTPRASPFEAKLQDIKLKMNRSPPCVNKRLGQDLARNPCVARKTKNHTPAMKTLKMAQENPHHIEVHLDKLYQMYRRSFANMVEAQRLLERSGHFMEFEEPSIQDFVFCQEAVGTEKVTQSETRRIDPFLTLNAAHLCEEPNSTYVEVSEKQDEISGGMNAEAANHELNEQSQSHVPPDSMNVYVPLNIEDILSNNYILEAKRPSSLWINYANKEISEKPTGQNRLSAQKIA